MVILDLDYIYDENDQNIFWVPTSYSKEFEQRYKREKKAKYAKPLNNYRNSKESFRNALKFDNVKSNPTPNISILQNDEMVADDIVEQDKSFDRDM